MLPGNSLFIVWKKSICLNGNSFPFKMHLEQTPPGMYADIVKHNGKSI